MYFKKIFEMRHSLAFRLTFWYASIFAISSLCAFLIVYLILSSVIQKRTDQKILNDLYEFSSIYRLKGENSIKVEMDIEAESEGVNAVFFRLLDAKGEAVSSSNMAYWGDVGIEKAALTRVAVRGDHVLETLTLPESSYKARILYGYLGPDRIVQIGHSLERDSRLLELFRTIFGTCMLVIIVVSAFVGLFMARNALSDVEQVTETALDITDGALGQRVKIKSGKNEIERLAMAFNKMLDRIQELVIGMKEMSDHIAHDLKTPITRIRGLAESELSAGGLNHKAQKLAAETIEECDYLLQMINTLLEISESETGITDPAKKGALDICEVVSEAVDLFQPTALEKDIELQSGLSGDCTLRGDIRSIQRMVVNLLENAIKYTRPGGSVNVSVREDNDYVTLEIRDTGIGISEKDLPHIFRRLYRCEPSRSQPGFGLGLSLALAVARSHGGDITVESRLGDGSSFKVTLPK